MAQNSRKAKSRTGVAIYMQDMQRQASGYGYESAPRRRSIDIPLESDTYGGNVRSNAKRNSIDIPLGNDKHMSSAQVGVSRSRMDIPVGNNDVTSVRRGKSFLQNAHRILQNTGLDMYLIRGMRANGQGGHGRFFQP